MSMVIVMEHSASEEQVQKVIESLVEVGYDVHRSSGIDYTVLGAVGVPHKPIDPRLVEVLPGVREVVRDLRALQAREPHLQARGHRGRRRRRAGRRARGDRDGRARARSRAPSR